MTRLVAADAAGIAQAADILRAGGLVAFPTETVYGLGADATNGTAVARIYEAKGRPQFNPLIVHVPSIETARTLGDFGPAAEKLAAAFWPGPLSLVVPLKAGAGIASLVTAGLATLAIRVPAHPVARALLHAAGRPIAAPSANPSGRTSPTRASHVAEGLGDRVDLILDGGPTRVGLESTIVGCAAGAPALLRPGGQARGDIEAVLGFELAVAAAPALPSAPGQLASHYAPRAALRLNAREVAPGEALLAFGPALPPGAERAAMVLNLSPAGDLREAAANLFDYLHRLDGSGAQRIAAMPIPHQGLGEAINDRLSRAAAPRPGAG